MIKKGLTTAGVLLASGGESNSVLKGIFDPIATGLSSELKVAIPAILGSLVTVVIIVWGIPLVKKIIKGFTRG